MVQNIVNDEIGPTKARSNTSELIEDAVIAVIAEHGVSQLTHRKVASAGSISLSATTYHYKTKADMLADACKKLLASHAGSFRSAVTDRDASDRRVDDLSELAFRSLCHAGGKYRAQTQAWCEIILEAARTQQGRDMARQAYTDLGRVWGECAIALDERRETHELESLSDLLVGSLFMLHTLRFDEEKIRGLSGDQGTEGLLATLARQSKPKGEMVEEVKSQETRDRLLNSALELMLEGGLSNVNYAKLAEKSGEAKTAPAYHFGSISGLREEAQRCILTDGVARFQEGLAAMAFEAGDPEALADNLFALLVREATHSGRQNIAFLATWLEAGRDDDLSGEVIEAICAMTAGWRKIMQQIAPKNDLAALKCATFMLGMLVRYISTGAKIGDLAKSKRKIAHFLGSKGVATGAGTLFQM